MGNILSSKEEDEMVRDSHGPKEHNSTEKCTVSDLSKEISAEISLESQQDGYLSGEESWNSTDVSLEKPNDDGPFVELILNLRQTSDKPQSFICRSKEVTFPYPITGKHLKRLIENQLQIPVCVQKLFFHSQPVLDNQCLKVLYLRDGDVITVEYTTQADIKEVVEIIQIMRNAIQFIEMHKQVLQNPSHKLATKMRVEIKDAINPLPVESLHRIYFTPSNSEKAIVNRLCFVHNNGITVIVKLHRLLSTFKWKRMPTEMQEMEYVVLTILWHLSAKFGIRCLLFKQPQLFSQLCASILREKIIDPQPYPQNQDLLLLKTMFQGMGLIVNLSEIPSCLMEIASQTQIIEQMSAAMLSPYLPFDCPHVVAITFLNLSYDPQTHKHLVSPQVLHGLVETCRRHPCQYLTFGHTGELAVRYFATLFFAVICTLSTDFATGPHFELYSGKVFSLITKFLHDSSIEQAKIAEKEGVYCWATMKPFISLVYSCNEAQMNSKLIEEKPLLKDLYLASLQRGIFLLQRACTTEDTLEILEMEGLIDFIICLPWHVSEGLAEEAGSIVQLLSQKRTLQPPTLKNIAKAKLAAWKVPFQDVMSNDYFDKARHHLTTLNYY